MRAERRALLAAWGIAKWARLTLTTRRDVERRQIRLWREMTPVVANTPAVAHLAGRKLADFPVVSPAEIRAGFDSWNTLGLTRAQAEAAATDAEGGGPGEAAPGVVAGFSTGSEGERGLFLTSAIERARYLGLSLARLLPLTAFIGRWRIALVLRANNRLYRDVETAGRFQFSYFPSDGDPSERAQALERFAPDILIAPAHVLADLAHRAEAGGFALPNLINAFWGAEPMGAAERAWIADALGVRPDPIYQATEGFLGAPCREGTLHLNEDALVVELEPVAGTTAFRPIVTELGRTSQPMIRVRLDDLVEPRPGRCACGSVLQGITPVEGRVRDLWCWDDRVVRPVEVWTAMEAALGPRADWRAEASPRGVALTVEGGGEGSGGAAAREAIAALVGGRPVTVKNAAPKPDGPKRRRVRWRP